jgi:hypothetical protein
VDAKHTLFLLRPIVSAGTVVERGVGTLRNEASYLFTSRSSCNELEVNQVKEKKWKAIGKASMRG